LLAKIIPVTMGGPEQLATWMDIEIACQWVAEHLTKMADSGTWTGKAALVRQVAFALA